MGSEALLRRRRHPPPSATIKKDSQSPSSNRRDNNETFDNTNTKDIYRDVPSKKQYDECAWFIIFLTALSYLIVSRSFGSNGSHSRGGLFSNLVAPYEVVSTSITVWGPNNDNEKMIKSVFHIDDDNNVSLTDGDEDDHSSTKRLSLQRGSQLEVVLSSDLDLDGNGLAGIDEVDDCIASSAVVECKTINKSSSKHNGDEYSKSNHDQQQLSTSRPYLSHLASTTWVHDPDLGRGYLLVNDAGRSGRIWRWEVGGGPISIGRTLLMERSGCRSGLWLDSEKEDFRHETTRIKAGICPENLKGDPTSSLSALNSSSSSSSLPLLLGSASIAVELSLGDGKKNLAVAEWGERRIVRVEEGTGARTPLVTLVPTEKEDLPHDNEDNVEQNNRWKKRRRLYRPNHLTYTPTGDLIFSDSFAIEGDDDCIGVGDTEVNASKCRQVGVVYRKKGAVHIPQISVEESRDAHGWIRATNTEEKGEDDEIEILFQHDGWIEGISLGLDHATLYVLTAGDRMDKLGRVTKIVYNLRIDPIDDDEDIEEDIEDDKESSNVSKGDDVQVNVFYESSSSDCKMNDFVRDGLFSSTGSMLAIDKIGTLYLISCPTSVTLLSPQGQMIGALAVDHARRTSRNYSRATHLTSIGFGEDGYLYITSVNELLRVKSRVGGLDLPAISVARPSSLKQ